MKKFIKLLSLVGLLALTACSGKENLGSDRLEAIQAKGVLEVATEPYFAPYEFIDPSKDGQDKYLGSDMEMAKYIADDLGVELKIVPLEFGAVLSGVSQGKYDLAISALAYTPQRAEAMTLSKAYRLPDNDKGYGILIREENKETIKNASELKGKTLVVQSGSIQELLLNEQVKDPAEVKKVSATTDGFLMVEEKKADACIVSVAMAELYIKANPNSGLTLVEGFKFDQDPSYSGTRIGMPKGEKELEERINKIIDELVESGLYMEWTKTAEDQAKSLGIE